MMNYKKIVAKLNEELTGMKAEHIEVIKNNGIKVHSIKITPDNSDICMNYNIPVEASEDEVLNMINSSVNDDISKGKELYSKTKSIFSSKERYFKQCKTLHS